jgi:hypothetical protein
VLSILEENREPGPGPAWELKEKGLAQAAAEGMRGNEGVDVDVV